MGYEFRRGSDAAQTALKINEVYGVSTTNEPMTRY